MKKKSFIGNPAMQFISQESIDRTEAPTEEKPDKKAPEGYRIDPRYIELKSKRLQILIQPSIHAKAKETSAELGISLNDFICRAIQEATDNEETRAHIEQSI